LLATPEFAPLLIQQQENGGRFTDVIFRVNGQHVCSNRAFLSCKCEYFNILLSDRFTESTQSVIEVTDVDFDSFVTVLRFLVLGDVSFSNEIAHKVRTLADKYDISSLVSECDSRIPATTIGDEVGQRLLEWELEKNAWIKVSVDEFTSQVRTDALAASARGSRCVKISFPSHHIFRDDRDITDEYQRALEHKLQHEEGFIIGFVDYNGQWRPGSFSLYYPNEVRWSMYRK
jgi:hypothetical protein